MTFVVDSSAILSLILDDEDAPAVRDVAPILAREGFTVPAHWHLETGNALLMAVRRRRLTKERLLDACRALDDLAPSVDPETSRHAHWETLRLAEEHKLTLYDAAYLELAIRLQARLVTLDQALETAGRQSGVLWVA